MAQAMSQERLPQMLAAAAADDAELRDVRDLIGDAGTEHNTDQCAGARLAEHPRVLRIEDTAAGKTHDVMQKTKRSMQRAVLVVDASVDVSGISLVNQLRCGLIIVRRPAACRRDGRRPAAFR